jgi:hypothetical protein
MITYADIAYTKASLTKNLVTDQTETSLTYALGSPVFHATYGHGIGTDTSTVTAIHMGGFNDQRITAVMRYRAPTVAGAENFGVLARFQTFENASYQTYYWLRVNAGVLKLTKVVGGSFTNLSTGAFALAADVDVTLVLSCVGSAISGSGTASGLGTVSLSSTDSAIPTGGLMGYRTLSKTGYCSSFTVEQL